MRRLIIAMKDDIQEFWATERPKVRDELLMPVGDAGVAIAAAIFLLLCFTAFIR